MKNKILTDYLRSDCGWHMMDLPSAYLSGNDGLIGANIRLSAPSVISETAEICDPDTVTIIGGRHF